MTVGLVLGDMLFDRLPGLDAAEAIFMSEDLGLATRVRHHQQKIVLLFSAMRHFRNALRAAGREVRYFELQDDSQSLLDRLKTLGPRKVITYEIADQFFRDALIAWGEENGVAVEFVPNPMFLTATSDWQAYRKRAKRLLMRDFYLQQRKRLGIMLEPDGSPVGGKWSFDEDNRRALPKSVLPPAVWRPMPDAITQEVIDLVRSEFAAHPGDAAEFAYPVTHAEAASWLDAFLIERLSRFGDYEDALSLRSDFVFHGVLTPMLNIGLLTPSQIVDRTLAFHAETPVPLNSLEGFLRQIIGWREFIRGMADEYPPIGSGSMNGLGHTRKLGEEWWTGTTGLLPLDHAIGKANRYGWCHHIERLMVVGSAMLMCEVEPSESYRWFMEMFIDSAEWVMGPNVLGMSQFADGGLFATKPYLSGSSYLRKMGDYPAGDWCDTWDGLYWRVVDRHRDLFAANPRMSVMVGSLDKLEPVRRDRIFSSAEAFIERVTKPY